MFVHQCMKTGEREDVKIFYFLSLLKSLLVLAQKFIILLKILLSLITMWESFFLHFFSKKNHTVLIEGFSFNKNLLALIQKSNIFTSNPTINWFHGVLFLLPSNFKTFVAFAKYSNKEKPQKHTLSPFKFVTFVFIFSDLKSSSSFCFRKCCNFVFHFRNKLFLLLLYSN